MKHQLDATLCRFYFCRVTLHVSGASAHHQEYLKLVQRPLVHVLSLPPALIRRCDDLPATITHVPVAAVLVLNTPDDGRLRPKHVEWPCRNKTCTVLHQVGVSFDQHYHVDTLRWLGGIWRLFSVPSQYTCVLHSGLKQNVILCAPFSQDFVHVNPSPHFRKKKMVLTGRTLNDHDSNKIAECTYWVSNSVLRRIFQMVVQSLSSLHEVPRRLLYGRQHRL